jgi:hypothetical protein
LGQDRARREIRNTADETSDFDGGVRESAPAPSDPEEEHNAFVLELLRESPHGGGEW